MEPEVFEDEVAASMTKLRGVVRRMLGNPDDSEDIVQDALLKAFENRESFREESSVSTWLTSIAMRLALNHLRSAKRWSWQAQSEVAKSLHADEQSKAHLMTLVASPGSRFDAREHIAFCFACVGRSLAPEEQAALILRDVFEYTNREAAKIVDTTESVLRAHLASGRRTMQERFDNLCGLVNKNGICHQCKGLRGHAAAENQGAELPDLGAGNGADELYQLRLRESRGADLDTGAMQTFHDYVAERISELETQR